MLKEVQVQEAYFKICCDSRIKLQLPSPYDMKSLDQHCNIISDFYKNQSDQMLELENLILMEEMRQKDRLKKHVRRNYDNFVSKVQQENMKIGKPNIIIPCL